MTNAVPRGLIKPVKCGLWRLSQVVQKVSPPDEEIPLVPLNAASNQSQARCHVHSKQQLVAPCKASETRQRGGIESLEHV